MNPWIFLKMHAYKFCPLKAPRINDISIVISTSSLRFLFLNTFPNKRKQGSLGKWQIPGLGQGKHKESHSILWQKVNPQKLMGRCQRTQEPA